MADVRIEMEPDWLAHVADAVEDFFDHRLGPDILSDMERGTPLLTGRLLASEDYTVIREHEMPTLIIGSFPDAEGDVDYAAAVELGFHGPELVRAHTRNGHPVRAHMRNANTPEQPYMRPALYRERSE